VLQAMGIEDDVLNGSIRLSLGAFTTAAEVAEAARRILLVANDLKMKERRRISPASGRVPGGNSL
jgi:cysteine sulfinate desulfinase/cysteine desulfurase-like protein